MLIDQEFIKRYFKQDPPKHEFYAQTVEIAEELAVHSKGATPKKLLSKARPNEDPIYQAWRLERHSPITKTYFGKAVNATQKIRKAEDWKIEFPKETVGAVPKEESLLKYMTKDYPYFDSFDNWFWTFAFGRMFDDPNIVIANLPLPKKNPKNDREYYRPFNYTFQSDQVVDFVENEYCVLISDEKSFVTVGKEQQKVGRIYYFIDKEGYLIAKQTGVLEDWNFSFETKNGQLNKIRLENSNYMPAFKIGGIIAEFKANEKLYKSFLDGVVNYFDEALMDHSDHLVNKAIHLHPDRWEIADQECKSCKGTGGVKRNGETYDCKKCAGMGKTVVKSPFNVKYIKAFDKASASEYASTPTPPMGYAGRPVEELKLTKQEVKDNIYSGLSAISMEFLMQEPANNSGVSKAYDTEALRTFFYGIGKHIIENIYIPTFYFTSKWRYPNLAEDQVMENLPLIKVPEDYDVIISTMVADEVEKAKTANLDPAIVNTLQVQYATKKFGDNSIIPLMMKRIYEIDPLVGKSEEEKMTILSNKGCTREDYMLSSKINAYTNRAMIENRDFLNLPYQARLDIYNKYVASDLAVMQKNIIPTTDFNVA